jgi:hypothetical protein
MNIQTPQTQNLKPNGKANVPNVNVPNALVSALAAEAAQGVLSLDIPAMMARGIALELAITLFQANTEAKLAKASTHNQGELYLKIGSKGTISLYGVNRQFPLSLYEEQWRRILGMADRILRTIDAMKANPAITQHIARKGVELQEHFGEDGKACPRTGKIAILA